jgi:hypothetical protein
MSEGGQRSPFLRSVADGKRFPKQALGQLPAVVGSLFGKVRSLPLLSLIDLDIYNLPLEGSNISYNFLETNVRHMRTDSGPECVD